MAGKYNKKEALELLVNAVNSRDPSKAFVIAIDGPAASGKTGFANELASQIGAFVIHTDDFFKPRSGKGELEISEFTGNFDLERFKSEVVNSILAGRKADFGIFNCETQRIEKREVCPANAVCIAEGAYSHCPLLGDYADIRLFITVSSETQNKRILSRNGESGLTMFKELWIPAENRYFSYFDIKNKSDIITEV